jgi:hypothetical protein
MHAYLMRMIFVMVPRISIACFLFNGKGGIPPRLNAEKLLCAENVMKNLLYLLYERCCLII